MEIAEVAGALEPFGTQRCALLVTSGETGRTEKLSCAWLTLKKKKIVINFMVNPEKYV